MDVAMERADSDYLITLQTITKALPVERVPVELLRTGFSPRVDGEDADHIRILAENADNLPPILVHRESMMVIDGAHRLRVSELLGSDHIAARFFDGDQADARLLAVAANIAHGRPCPPPTGQQPRCASSQPTRSGPTGRSPRSPASPRRRSHGCARNWRCRSPTPEWGVTDGSVRSTPHADGSGPAS